MGDAGTIPAPCSDCGDYGYGEEEGPEARECAADGFGSSGGEGR